MQLSTALGNVFLLQNKNRQSAVQHLSRIQSSRVARSINLYSQWCMFLHLHQLLSFGYMFTKFSVNKQHYQHQTYKNDLSSAYRYALWLKSSIRAISQRAPAVESSSYGVFMYEMLMMMAREVLLRKQLVVLPKPHQHF